MVFERIVAATRAHLVGAPGCLRVFRPRPLDLLAADTSDTLHQVQRVLIVAFFHVCTETILENDEVMFVRAVRKRNLEVHEKVIDMLENVKHLLIDNVVRDHEHWELAVNSKIYVTVPENT